MEQSAPRPSRRRWLYLLYVVTWLVGSIIIDIPVLGGLARILNQLDPGLRLVFYLMPPLLSALLVLGVLQIIAMYRYWFGPHE